MIAHRGDTAPTDVTMDCLQQVSWEDEWSSGVRGSRAFWEAGVLKMPHVFRIDLVKPLADRLLFLMIKVRPEGQYSGGRQ